MNVDINATKETPTANHSEIQWRTKQKDCEAKEALALIRADDKAALINYELLQLCTQEQQEKIQKLMSRADNKKYSLWQNMRELGMSDQTFKDFKKPENQTLRAIDLPTSEEVYN